MIKFKSISRTIQVQSIDNNKEKVESNFKEMDPNIVRYYQLVQKINELNIEIVNVESSMAFSTQSFVSSSNKGMFNKNIKSYKNRINDLNNQINAARKELDLLAKKNPYLNIGNQSSNISSFKSR